MRTEEEVAADNKRLFKKVGLVILGIVILFVLIGLFTHHDTSTQATEKATKVSLVDQVNKALDSYGDDKSTLASMPFGGAQGDIVGVEADGDDGVKVKVSTYYDKSGEDGGKTIAHTIYSAVCLDVPDLETLYVTSTSSGLDSQSVYRSDVPACKK